MDLGNNYLDVANLVLFAFHGTTLGIGWVWCSSCIDRFQCYACSSWLQHNRTLHEIYHKGSATCQVRTCS